MMLSPEAFAAMHEDDSYEELLSLRDEMIEDLRDYESEEPDESAYQILPSPDTRYSVNLLCVAEICRLIEKKFRETKENA